MKLDDVIAAWNAQADEYNQWSDLGDDERFDWIRKHVLEEAAGVCDGAEAWCEGVLCCRG